MASIRQQGEVFEIRECVPSEVGPRQRSLARFRRILTPEILARAASMARRPFDPEALLARARERGIPVAASHRTTGARRLLGFLHRGGRIDPVVCELLRDALAAHAASVVPEHLADVVDCLGQSETARGRTLRGLLRTASRVARSRVTPRPSIDEAFPRFDSGHRPSPGLADAAR